MKLEKYSEAEKELLAGFEASKRGLGETDKDTRSFLSHLVGAYKAQGRGEDARKTAARLRRLNDAAKAEEKHRKSAAGAKKTGR